MWRRPRISSISCIYDSYGCRLQGRNAEIAANNEESFHTCNLSRCSFETQKKFGVLDNFCRLTSATAAELKKQGKNPQSAIADLERTDFQYNLLDGNELKILLEGSSLKEGPNWRIGSFWASIDSFVR
jgi:hypothetical protein